MAQADFAYATANDRAGLALTVSVFADHALLRGELCEDIENAGLSLREAGPVAALSEGEVRALGELVVVDCPTPDPAALAALSRLDMRAANSGTHLVVSTTVDALEAMFACLDQSRPQILVNPNRAERVIALGRALARIPAMRVRELSEDDRLVLLRLTKQVGEIAERLERLKAGTIEPAGGITNDGGDSVFCFESPAPGYRGGDGNGNGERMARPPLPDPRLVRRIIRQRQARARFFDGELFADPAWDILLDLTAARAEHVRVSVTSLCIASGVPPTTALRWISQMVDAGLLVRIEDEEDSRRAFIALSDRAAHAMARYFAEIGRDATKLS